MRCPLLVCEDYALNQFNAVQAALPAGVVHLLEHKAVELLVMAQLLKSRSRNAVAVGQFLERGLVGNDNSNGLVLVLRGVDADVADNGA